MAQPTVQAVVPAPRRSPRRKDIQPVRFEALHPARPSILPQMRSRYNLEGIAQLGDNIADLGLIEPTGIAELDHSHAVEYLEYFSRRYGADLKLADYPLDSSGYYLFVIYGGRRTIAGKGLYLNGCRSCRAAGRSVAQCLKRHPMVPSDGLPTMIYHNIDPMLAQRLQGVENTYEPPTRDDDAAYLRAQWEDELRLNPKLTKARFARLMNKSCDYINDSLRFCDLPAEVKHMVKEGYLPFTAAVELSRLAVAGLSAERVIRTAQQAIAGHLKVSDIRPLVANIIQESQNATAELFVIDEAAEHQRAVKGLVDKRALTALRVEGGELRQLKSAMDKGILPTCDPMTNPQVQELERQGSELRETLFS